MCNKFRSMENTKLLARLRRTDFCYFTTSKDDPTLDLSTNTARWEAYNTKKNGAPPARKLVPFRKIMDDSIIDLSISKEGWKA